MTLDLPPAIDVPATITAIGALVTAVGVIVLGVLSYFAKRAAEEAKSEILDSKTRLIELDGKVYELGQAVDGRLSKLLELADQNAVIRERSALAKGRLEGAALERADSDNAKQETA